jgi:hypothetical protein
MRKLMVWFWLMAALLMLPTMAQAQTAPNRGTPEDQKACSGDARRHCRAVLDHGDMAVPGRCYENMGSDPERL